MCAHDSGALRWVKTSDNARRMPDRFCIPLNVCLEVVSKHRTTKPTLFIFYAGPSDSTPEDPGPLAWCYDLPFVYVARNGSPLTGRAHTHKLGYLSLKTDQSVNSAPAFMLRPVMASTSFVNMPRTVVHRYYKPEYDIKYAIEDALASTRESSVPTITISQFYSVTLQKTVQAA